MSNTTSLKHTSTLPAASTNKAICLAEFEQFRKDLFDLQNVFYASSSMALLVILQGVDAAGKDGTIRHVFNSMNPQGVQVTSFKRPTEEELRHDFLWRIYPHFPAKGMMRVFNRSYYEDVLQPTLAGTLDEQGKRHRYQLINGLEDHLVRNDTIVLKFLLHISKDEQKQRIESRLTKPHKRWKYSPEDLKAWERYDTHVGVYDDIIKNTSACPWHVVPADKKWYRNHFIASTLKNTLESLRLMYPTP